MGQTVMGWTGRQRKVYHPEPPHAQSLFLFPIVFGINLIQFFDGKNKIGLGKI